MKKLQTILFGILFALLLTGSAFADVVGGPLYALAVGVPLIAIGIAILIAVLVIRAVYRVVKQRKNELEQSEEMTCRHDDAESNARKSSWDNRDPWD